MTFVRGARLPPLHEAVPRREKMNPRPVLEPLEKRQLFSVSAGENAAWELLDSISEARAVTTAAAPTAARPMRNPKRRVTASVASPPNRSPGTLRINGRPAKVPRETAVKPCCSLSHVGSHVIQK